MIQIDIHHQNSRSSSSRSADEDRSVPLKVSSPLLPPRMEQRRNPPCLWIDSTQITRFAEIAQVTGPGKVFGVVRAAVFLSNNVLRMKRKQRQVSFVQPTILAPTSCPLADETAKSDVHQAPFRFDSKTRACACNRARNSPANTFVSYSTRSSGSSSPSLHLWANSSIRAIATESARTSSSARAASGFNRRTTGSTMQSRILDVDLAYMSKVYHTGSANGENDYREFPDWTISVFDLLKLIASHAMLAVTSEFTSCTQN